MYVKLFFFFVCFVFKGDYIDSSRNAKHTHKNLEPQFGIKNKGSATLQY